MRALPPYVLDMMDGEEYRRLAGPMSAFVRDLQGQPDLQGRFLNSLSYIEHHGSRFLLLSHQRHTMSATVLKHIVEEARHAHALRRMAEKIAKRPLNYTDPDLLAGPAAKMYFSRLVATITKACRETENGVMLPYLYISGVIEVRALWLYTMYEEILKEYKQSISFAGILAEEIGHIHEIATMLATLDPQAEMKLEEFLRVDGRLFLRFFSATLKAMHESDRIENRNLAFA